MGHFGGEGGDDGLVEDDEEEAKDAIPIRRGALLGYTTRCEKTNMLCELIRFIE